MNNSELQGDQPQAMAAIKRWLSDPLSKGSLKVLEGPAGTGKTFLLGQVVGRARSLGLNVGVTATTHAAANVLESKMPGGVKTSTLPVTSRVPRAGRRFLLLSKAASGPR